MIVKKMENKRIIQRKVDVNKTPSKSGISKSESNNSNIYHTYIKEEAGENVFNYFDELGVFQSNEVLILSSKHSFSYDEEYVNNVRTIFNLKILNKLSKINFLFFNLNKVIPTDGYYIGCYEDIYMAKQKMAEKYPKAIVNTWFWLFNCIPQLILNLPVLDLISSSLGINYQKCLTIHEVQKLMHKNGFNVVDTKEFNNRSYFIAKKNKRVKHRKLVILNFLEQMFNKNLIINI